jgi:hypothetical protein
MPDMTTLDDTRLLRRIRLVLGLFVVALVLSGATAFALPWEVRLLNDRFGVGTATDDALPGMAGWLARVGEALDAVDRDYPFLLYGTDWLAFAHLVIAVAFIGPLRDPVKNLWVIDFGMIACAAVIPLALLCGPIRGIPFWWQLIDCSFGVVGIVPLAMVRRWIEQTAAARELL